MQTAIYLIITMAGWAYWNVASKKATETIPFQGVQFVFALSAIVAAPIFYLLLPKDIKWHWQGIAWSSSAYVATSIAVFSYVYLLSKHNVSSIIPIANSYPVFVVLFTTIFMKEDYSIQKFIGLLLVLTGVFVSTR